MEDVFPNKEAKLGKRLFRKQFMAVGETKRHQNDRKRGEGKMANIYSEVYVSRSSGKGKEKKDDISKSGAQLLFSRKAPRLKTK